MHRKYLLAVAAFCLASPAAGVFAQGKIGVVQIERIVRDSQPAMRSALFPHTPVGSESRVQVALRVEEGGNLNPERLL